MLVFPHRSHDAPLRGGVEAKGGGDVNLVPKAFPLLGKEKEVLETRLAFDLTKEVSVDYSLG